MLIVLSFLVLLAPFFYAVLFTSGLSPQTKVTVAISSFALIATLPLVFFLLESKMG